MVIAGDVEPWKLVKHIPELCDKNKMPYVFVPSKTDLGFSCLAQRPIAVAMILPGARKGKPYVYKECYDKVINNLKEMVVCVIIIIN